jgi:hypothetical protein
MFGVSIYQSAVNFGGNEDPSKTYFEEKMATLKALEEKR